MIKAINFRKFGKLDKVPHQRLPIDTTLLPVTDVFDWNWEAINEKNEDGSRKYRYIINEGSSRSSKTFSLINCFDKYARENNNKRLTVWRNTKIDCKKTVLHDAVAHFKNTKRYGDGQVFNKTESIFTYKNDSTFEIHGTDDINTVMGLTQSAAWLNEPYVISKDIFDQIDQRTADFIFIDWNPKQSHFIEDLKKDPRTRLIKSTFLNNPFCPTESRLKLLGYQPIKMSAIVVDKLLTEVEARAYNCGTNTNLFDVDQIAELSRCQENEVKNSANEYNWSVYGLGLKAERPNRIFKWEEIPEHVYRALDLNKYNGVDWGEVDPWGMLEAKYYDGNLYLHELNYKSEGEIRLNLSPNERAQVLEDEGLVPYHFKKVGISQDNPIICDNNRPLKIRALRNHGWQAMPASKAKGSIIDGITLLMNLKVFYTHTSLNIKAEQENYSRKTGTQGEVLEEPEDTNNHLIDPTRYIAGYLQSIGVIKIV